MDSNGIIIVKGFDWGPAVTKVVIKLGIDFDKPETLIRLCSVLRKKERTPLAPRIRKEK